MIASAIIVQGRIIRAFIKALGMQAQNEYHKNRLEYPAYIEKDFADLIESEGINENQVISEARK